MNNCKACDFEVSHKFCPNCGSRVAVKRINGSYLLHEIEHVLHFERGILRPCLLTSWVYYITEKGAVEFTKMGIDLSEIKS